MVQFLGKKGQDAKLPPATTPAEREKQLCMLAYDRVETRIREGTASAQELVYFLKLASEREELEKEYLKRQSKLAESKIKAIDESEHASQMFQEAVNAMRRYQGSGEDEEDG